MTNTSLEQLRDFLERVKPVLKPTMRIADYGGTKKIGSNVVKKMLKGGGLKDYHMLDFDNGFDLRKSIKGKKFDLGICMDLLEHTTNPFLVAKNIIDINYPVRIAQKQGYDELSGLDAQANEERHPEEFSCFDRSNKTDSKAKRDGQ